MFEKYFQIINGNIVNIIYNFFISRRVFDFFVLLSFQYLKNKKMRFCVSIYIKFVCWNYLRRTVLAPNWPVPNILRQTVPCWNVSAPNGPIPNTTGWHDECAHNKCDPTEGPQTKCPKNSSNYQVNVNNYHLIFFLKKKIC